MIREALPPWVRRVPLLFQRMQWMLAGRTFSMDEVAADETVAVGSTHVWEFVNQSNGMGMGMMRNLRAGVVTIGLLAS